MKILFFLPALNSGGAERVVVTIANSLAAEGNVIEILTLNSSRSFYSINEQVTVVGINETISANGFKRKLLIPYVEYKRRKKYISAVNNFQPDVVISFLYTTNVLSILSRNKVHIPLIVSERSDPSHYGRIQQLICQKMYVRADRIVCQGKVVADYYSQYGGRCKIIPNPLNKKSVGEYNPQKNKRIVTVGRLIPAKNHNLLIEAFKEISCEFPDYILEIFGEGELRQELQDKIDSLGLNQKVFLRGSKQNVIAELNDAACFVLTSDFEGFPNVLIEAMSTGIPIITTDFPSGIARELIQNEENGYLIDVGNHEQLVRALKCMLSNEKKQAEFAERNLGIINEYSEANIAQKWIDVCNEVISSTKKNEGE